MTKRSAYQQLCRQHGAAAVHRDMPDQVFGTNETEQLDVALEKARIGSVLLGMKVDD
jgi:hypothetical protein